jgi:hypothetical protein
MEWRATTGRSARVARLELAAPPRKQAQPLLARRRRLVAEVVGPPAERVDGGEVAAQPRRDQRAQHAEVLVLAIGQRSAPRRGGRLVHRRRQAGPHALRAEFAQLCGHDRHGAEL